MEENKRRRASRGARIGAAVLLLPLVYVASIGPVFVMAGWLSIPWQTARNYLFPLMWVRENCSPARDLIDWYMRVLGFNG
jgi:hypothetical protein